MKRMLRLLLLLVSLPLLASQSSFNRDELLGNILKNSLELLHYSHKKIDDSLSEKAFDLYIKRVDAGKRFLLQSDVNYLRKYRHAFDDQLIQGKSDVVNDTLSILNNRIKQIKDFSLLTLKQPFNLSQKDFIETDPDKTTFQPTLKNLQSHWEKILRLAILNRYMDEEKEQELKLKNKKITKPEMLSPTQIEVKTREAIAKNYSSIFERLLQENKEDLVEKFINSITNIFDPHTAYLPPEKKEDFDIDMRGTLEGIGALLREDDAYIKVVHIIPGSASWKQKKPEQLEPEDTILKVGQGDTEPVDIVNMRLTDAVKLIRGPRGSTVKLTIKKSDGRLVVIPIVRDTVEIEETYAKSLILKENNADTIKVGYLYLPKFYRDFADGNKGRNCTEDVQKELKKLKAAQVNGVILDIRSNGGGALEDARTISGLFVPQGPVVQVKKSDGGMDILKDTDTKTEYDGPLVVLVDRFSASASEIVAAALQDYQRAIIIGPTQTHGKGTVQAVLNLDNSVQTPQSLDPLGALKVTIQKFYRINGGSTQYKGVTPDIILPDPYDFLKSGERELEYSLPWDHVGGLAFQKWEQLTNIKKTLLARSKIRINKNADFKKIEERVKILKKRKDLSTQSLNLEVVKNQVKLMEQEDQKFKLKAPQEPLIFLDIEGHGLKFVKNTKKKKDNKEEDTDESSTDFVAENEEFEWINPLYQDPYLRESLAIVKDIISLQQRSNRYGLAQ